ncbi:MAG: precorrin-2 C(20)-methyltransferase [Eubacteriales bacterium]|nr:precorrin-2 C(20)-methyltransferase [Eubacteriales bacterium]
MAGVLYGIGVGPGDPELMTLKAVKTVRGCDVIVVPREDYRESAAYQIALGAIRELEQMTVVGVSMPMTKDRSVLDENYRSIADRIERWLDEGKQVGVLTLGDATIYSTYLYLHRLVTEDGYETRIINGIPSFCAAAARLNMGLAERSEELHVIPASYQVEEALKLPGTKILMKTGRQIGRVKELLRAADAQVITVENCGMDGEKVWYGIDEIQEQAGYYTLMIVRNEA